MNEFKGTIGNWEVKGEKYFTIESKLLPASQEIATFPTIATVNTTFISLSEAKANANLIAAAPDMLKVLMCLNIQGGHGLTEHAEIIRVINKALGINE